MNGEFYRLHETGKQPVEMDQEPGRIAGRFAWASRRTSEKGGAVHGPAR